VYESVGVCAYVYIVMYIYVYILVCVYIFVYSCVYVYVSVGIRAPPIWSYRDQHSKGQRVCVGVYVRVCVRVCVREFFHEYVYMYLRIHVSILRYQSLCVSCDEKNKKSSCVSKINSLPHAL